MDTERKISHGLEQLIYNYGDPYQKRSDNPKMETGKQWKEIYMRYNISSSNTQLYNPWKNKSDRSIQEQKKGTNRIMDQIENPRYW